MGAIVVVATAGFAFVPDGRAGDVVPTSQFSSPVNQKQGRTLGGAIDGSPGSNCSCRHKGRDVMLGQAICMQTPSGPVRAVCGRYLNNTAWKISKDPCYVS